VRTDKGLALKEYALIVLITRELRISRPVGQILVRKGKRLCLMVLVKTAQITMFYPKIKRDVGSHCVKKDNSCKKMGNAKIVIHIWCLLMTLRVVINQPVRRDKSCERMENVRTAMTT